MITLYNSLSRKREEFLPADGKTVKFYTCGPTVYDFLHIGNLRSYTTWDVLKNILRYEGFVVNHVMNITDVGHLVADSDDGEDKMELAKKREGKTAWDLADRYTHYFKQDFKDLGIQLADHLVPATETIKEQIALALKLDEAGYLYKTSDGMYFDTARFPHYGALARLENVELQAGARVAMGEKKSPTDFAVWKFSPKGEKRDMEWESPWGKGFPGWHLECSAIAMKYLGETLDIHCGGIDHLTIHHPNEIAQSEAVTGKPFARFWLHNAFLNFGDLKMSKSAGTYITLQDIKEKGIRPLAYRYWLLQTHYRKTLQFSWEALEAAATGLENLYEQIAYLDDPVDIIPDSVLQEAWANLSVDIGTPQALAQIPTILAMHQPTGVKMGALKIIDELLGLGLVQERNRRRAIPQIAHGLLEDRKEARAAEDWARADQLRDELDKLGVTVKDTKEGQVGVLKN